MPDPALATLSTEARNPASAHIDELSTVDMLRILNAEDALVAAAVATQIPQIAEAIDRIVPRLEAGGRLFYIGAGTSGRLGVLDASECPPTFAVPPSLVQGIIAGGDAALRRSSEASEDSPEQGAADLTAHGFCTAASPGTPASPDTLVGIAASGRTPYVLGALAHARSLGALTIALSCVQDAAIARAADLAITPVTGPEVITGSTRMKAGTATKLVLNMLSTGIMIRMGATYGNLMVNVQPTNAKLLDRAHRILIAATAEPESTLTPDTAATLLAQAGSLKAAILMRKRQLSRREADQLLSATNGVLAEALRF